MISSNGTCSRISCLFKFGFFLSINCIVTCAIIWGKTLIVHGVRKLILPNFNSISNAISQYTYWFIYHNYVSWLTRKFISWHFSSTGDMLQKTSATFLSVFALKTQLVSCLSLEFQANCSTIHPVSYKDHQGVILSQTIFKIRWTIIHYQDYKTELRIKALDFSQATFCTCWVLQIESFSDSKHAVIQLSYDI